MFKIQKLGRTSQPPYCIKFLCYNIFHNQKWGRCAACNRLADLSHKIDFRFGTLKAVDISLTCTTPPHQRRSVRQSKNMTAIILEPHNPRWATEFSCTKTKLQAILSNVPIICIEHVGSTSIPSLLAKPVLDIDIIVTPQNLSAARAALVNVGYEDRGEQGVSGRVAFRQPIDIKGNEMKRNTYVVIEGCLALRNHLDLRRILQEDEGLRREYKNVKRVLVRGGVGDVDEYCRGKTEVMLKILRRAGWNEVDLEEVRMAN